jgi:hypothetical protein
MSDPQLSPRQQMLREVRLLLGDGMITLELDPDHFDVAFEVAIGRYRQRSGNAMEEAFLFLDVQPDTSVYRLPDDVQEVHTVYRRTIGGSSGGASIDPFSLAFTNNIYMVQNPGALGTTGSGMLSTYDFAMQYQSLIGRMFGREVMFTWNAATKILSLERKFNSAEQVVLHIYNVKPEAVLMADPYAKPWLRDYTIAWCKQMMGEARAKFSTVAGPQGGFSLNGDAMKTEAKAEMERLETELKDFVDQHVGYPFIVG